MGSTPTSHIDVLIVGAGPAGLMAATWMARCGINARIVDKRGTKIFTGYELIWPKSNSFLIFDSFDFADRVWKESNHMLEICLWNPDAEGKLRRSGRMPDTIPGITSSSPSSMKRSGDAENSCTGRIERFFLDSLKEHSDIRVERGVLPESLSFDESKEEDPDAYPIEVILQHLHNDDTNPEQAQATADGAAMSDGLFRSNMAADDTDELLSKAHINGLAGTSETVRAKYMIGCDGAHSWTRRQLGYKLEGEQTDYIWYTDIRMRCAIHSANSGSVMVIPRENKLVRLYIQITTTENGAKIERSTINPAMILEAAQRTMAPYKITYEYCDWWTAYQIGQRVGSDFSKNERIFLAGDAVHTHSPKAGQGMNVSMQDTFNLGWKIASVLNGEADRSVLKTYQSERRRIAQDLIEFDHKFSRLFSGRPAKDVTDETGISMEEFKDTFQKGLLFASGVAVDYGTSILIAKEGDATSQGDGTIVSQDMRLRVVGKQDLTKNIKIGMRMPSFKVLNQSDARPWHFQERLKSDGRWRIIVFAGDISDSNQMSRITALGPKLQSLLTKYTLRGKKIDSVLEVLMIHSAPRIAVEFFDLPEIFHPFTEKEGYDYSKVYVDDISYHEGHGRAYENYGVDKKEGCLVVLRPDQYVSWVGTLDDEEDMGRFFEGFMKTRR
ncbi:phenol 2-monooxygenase protein [Rutstroemia sp. NJR-2017a WRK4]|nr:phenol 2-monooxygenase protein [Rutstroemia sp. NJR-2017a WRK4]